jgi:hypothetical protein
MKDKRPSITTQANNWVIPSYLALVFAPLAHILALGLWVSHLPLPLTKDRSVLDLSSTGKLSSIRPINELIISPSAQSPVPADPRGSCRFP